MFPVERESKRQALLEAVESVRDTLQSSANESEAGATLAPPAVKALREAELLRLKLPAELGGAEADPMLQMEVLEELTYIDPASGWCTMVGATCIGNMGAYLPEAGFEKVFADGNIPTAAGSFFPGGTAIPREGGYRVTGHWRFASGISHSDWVVGGAVVAQEEQSQAQQDGLPPEVISVVLSKADITIHDNWRVMGLKATGSCDFTVTDQFIPQELTFQGRALSPIPVRGGPMYRLPIIPFVACEHIGFAAGVARRALDELIQKTKTQRGQFRPSALPERHVFHRFVGESGIKLRAARSLAFDLYEEVWDKVCGGESVGPDMQAQLRSVATYITDIAVEVTTQAFRYGGAGALFQPNIFELLLREMNAAAQHILVSESAYENHGKFLLGLPDANPMG